MNAIIALKYATVFPDIEADYIGVDIGALLLAKQQKHMVLAVGDFDSVSREELEIIKAYSDEVIILNPIKDDADAEHAINEALARGYQKLYMTGGLSGRMDHTIINLRMVLKYAPKLEIYDEHNHVYAYEKGVYTITKNEYKYISFFTDSKAVVTFAGFKYDIKDRVLTPNDLYTGSNEIVGQTAKLTIHEGKLIVIESKD